MKLTEMFVAVVPHFSSDLAACYEDESGELVAQFSMDDHIPEEDPSPDGVVVLRMFCWLGMKMFVRQGSPVSSYQEYLDAVERVKES